MTKLKPILIIIGIITLLLIIGCNNSNPTLHFVMNITYPEPVGCAIQCYNEQCNGTLNSESLQKVCITIDANYAINRTNTSVFIFGVNEDNLIPITTFYIYNGTMKHKSEMMKDIVKAERGIENENKNT